MPTLSVIVVAYRMKRQATNTIKSLSTQLQKDVCESDYEIIIVENYSDDMLDPDELKAFGSNITYHPRSSPDKSPAQAINQGLSKARGAWIGLLIDGARMVTPRVIATALMVARSGSNGLLAIPGYFLGPCEHQYASEFNYTEIAEKNLLETARWEENPYRLFDIGTISAANPRGLFIPFLESNCFFSTASNFQAIGGADERFNLPGGGSLNLHMYRKIAILPECTHYFIAPGEGSFHQIHGGETTSTRDDRESLLLQYSKQLKEIWGDQPFRPVAREPILIGASTSYALRYLLFSSRKAWRRMKIMDDENQLFWPDDDCFDRYTEQEA